MPSRHLPLAAREIALAPTHPGFGTAFGDTALIRPPQRPEQFKPQELPDAHHAWAAHVAAGRIGGNPPAPLEVAANRDRTAALFAELAQERRRAEHDLRWGIRR